MSQEQMSHKDHLRVERRANESFVRTYTRHGKCLPPLSEADQKAMEFFNSIQRELQRQHLMTIYTEHDE